MADPALPAIIEAIAAKLEAIVPTEEPGKTFRRSEETAPSTTRVTRHFRIDFGGQPADLSAAGTPGSAQTVGIAEVLAAFRISVEYPIARRAKALTTIIASDSEHIRRALSRSANWNGTAVRALRSFRSTVDRSQEQPTESEPGLLYLDVEATFLYRETES